jgi:hypothetical protein
MEKCSMIERIQCGSVPVHVLALMRWCQDQNIPITVHPANSKHGTVAYINPRTTKRWERMIASLKALDWKFYHHPPSNSIYKTIAFENVTI